MKTSRCKACSLCMVNKRLTKIKQVNDYFTWIFQSKLDRVHHLLHWSSLWPVWLNHTHLGYMHSRSFPPLKLGIFEYSQTSRRQPPSENSKNVLSQSLILEPLVNNHLQWATAKPLHFGWSLMGDSTVLKLMMLQDAQGMWFLTSCYDLAWTEVWMGQH